MAEGINREPGMDDTQISVPRGEGDILNIRLLARDAARRVSTSGNAWVVSLDLIDHDTSAAECVAEVKRRAEKKLDIVIDCSGVTAIDSTAVGRIHMMRKHIAATGGSVKLVNVNPALQEELHIMRMDTIFEVVPMAKPAEDGIGQSSMES